MALQGTAVVEMVEPETVRDWLETDQALVVDVREAHEHAVMHIPGTNLMPLSGFDPAAVPRDPARHLVIYCRSGVRCGHAAEQLVAAGYDQPIFRMNGGILGWVVMGGATESGA